MFAVRRLFAVGSVLTLIGALASTHIWGQAGGRGKSPLDSTDTKRPIETSSVSEMALSRFSDQPLVLYHRPDQAETLLALQVKPRLKAGPTRPRDYLVLIDTAAHMAGGDLKTAQQLLHSFVQKVGAEDRLALWTVNTKFHDLLGGFQPCRDVHDAVKNQPGNLLAALHNNAESCRKLGTALKKLGDDYPSGAVNFRAALPEAIKLFDGKRDRQHVILFFGSGQSIAGPVDAELRASLCKDMVANRIAFYSVPLGGYLDPYNLHGFANYTGGKVVRHGLGSTAEKWGANLFEALAQPILYDAEIQLPAKVAEAMPSTLPPLRPDVPTLVVGKFAGVPDKNEARFDYTLKGKVEGDEQTISVSEKMVKPEEENYFLVNMLDQWKAQKDRPALLPADRTLAHAFETNQLARADLVAQADWALEKKKFDVAHRLYEQALKADPTSERAKAGLRLVDDLRTGKKTLEDAKAWLKLKKGDLVKAKKLDNQYGGKVALLPVEEIFAEQDKKDAPPPLAPDQADQNRIRDIQARQAIVDQSQRQIVDDAIRQANQTVTTRPDDAHEFLKRTLDSVRTNPDISEDVRRNLSNRLERAIQNVDIRGAVVRRDQDEALRLLANANARATLGAQERLEQDRVRERMRVYHNLMDQAREQQAYRQAQAIRKDLIDQGLPVPPAVTAGYYVGLAGYHLREVQELRRIRNERWLATMLEVERSHIPFPDEPPVEYPPAATWRALSEMRKARYESATFGADLPERGIELRNQLGQMVDYPGLEDARATLTDVLDQLSKRYNLTFDINDKAFEMDQLKDVARLPVAETPIPEMRTTLGTVLRKILRRIPAPSGTTYLIRRDVIEITTGTFAAAEKAVRVYPVADLVTPIPNAFNPLMLQGAATIFGISNGALGGFAGIGGLGGLGALGGARGLGALGLGGGIAGLAGLGGGGLGGLGGIGGIAGLGGGGFNQLGVGGGGQGGFQGNFQGQGNLGVGGGVVGFGGQQLGQFGNLGGQFGLQGGNQSSILITLIRQVVGRSRDWAINFDPVTGQPVNPLDDQAQAPEGLNQENNQLGFFPPAQALAVKASSTIHTRPSNLIINPNAAIAALPGGRDPKLRVAPHSEERPDLDPKKVWQDALVKGISNPSLIIATADFLVLAQKFDHAVEFLKANLRQGIVVEPWVYKSLALALRLSGGAAEEIERAEVSAADMEPKNGRGYLEAATALAHDEKYGLALAFCRQAALLEPGLSHAYEEALNYAELARDPQAMQWAAGNLLRHDWPGENKPLHDRALQKIDALGKVLDQQGRKDEAERLSKAVAGTRLRDLVVKLCWQGDADLDLHVLEPTGSMCSPLHRQTIGGGVLIGDSLVDMTSETYLAAEAFSGDYEIEIEKIWGHPLNNKAQLKIIHHQGTPAEREELRTVELKSRISERIKVKVADGRRTETAYVPPPSAQKKPDAAPEAVDNPNKVFLQLRNLADPEVTGIGRGFSGGVGSQGQPVLPSDIKSGKRSTNAVPDNDRTLYQTRIKPFVQNAMDVTASAVLSADRRSVRLSVTPVFNTVTGVRNTPAVVNPTIPGGR